MFKTLLLVGFIAVVGGYLAYLLVKPTPNKYYAKARKAHKIGEKCYSCNDIDLAEEYYQDAEEFRTKARALEQSSTS